jgi:hypothetical protein
MALATCRRRQGLTGGRASASAVCSRAGRPCVRQGAVKTSARRGRGGAAPAVGRPPASGIDSEGRRRPRLEWIDPADIPGLDVLAGGGVCGVSGGGVCGVGGGGGGGGGWEAFGADSEETPPPLPPRNAEAVPLPRAAAPQYAEGEADGEAAGELLPWPM